MKRPLLMLLILLFLVAPAISAGEKRVEVPAVDSPSLGPENAPVTIIEFIDFQ